jgi:hypothetical protein
MTLSEKIIKSLRMAQDSGLSNSHLETMISDGPTKIAAALQALQEQERVIKGSDGCWYLGDSELPGSGVSLKLPPPVVLLPDDASLVGGTLKVYAGTPPSSPDGKPEGPLLMEYEVKKTKPAPAPAAPKKAPAEPAARPVGFIPATDKLLAWIEAQPDDAPPISWMELGDLLQVKRSALGKARKNLADKGKIDLVVKLDRLAQRQNSLAKRARKITQVRQELPDVASAINNDLLEMAHRLRVVELPYRWREHRATLLELDNFLADVMGFTVDRQTRQALRDVSDWLEEMGRGT